MVSCSRFVFTGFLFGGTVFAFEAISCAVGNESNQVEHMVARFVGFTEAS